MSTILIPILYVLAGCALLTGLHHGLAAITEHTRRLYILFALASISVAGHTFFRACAYSATTVVEYVDMRQWEVAFLCGVFIPFCWFIADLTRIRPKLFLTILSVLWLLLFAANAILPYGAQFPELPAQLHYIHLPWGEAVVDMSVLPFSAWHYFGWSLILISVLFAFYADEVAARMAQGKNIPYLKWTLGIFTFLVFGNVIVNANLIHFIHTSDFAFIVLILLMHHRLVTQPREQQRQIYDILQHLPIGVCQKDLDGRYLFINKMFRNLTCNESDDFNRDVQIFGPNLARQFRERELEMIRKAEDIESEYTVMRDADRRIIKLIQFPIMDSRGAPSSLCSLHLDITTDRAKDESMRRLQMQLWRADRLSNSSAISKSLAHEICQPLAAILNNAQAALRFMAQGDADMEELKSILEDIVRDEKRAGAVVNGLRSMLQSQEVPFEIVALDQVIEDVISLLNTEFIQQGVRVEKDIAKGLWVRANKTHLQQVMLNLIMNALEAMEEAQIGDRTLWVMAGAADDNTVITSARDNGPGIPPEKLNDIFDGFYTTKAKGLGIGLEVCRAIMESHGGKVWAHADVEGGAIFSFTLPFLGPPELPAENSLPTSPYLSKELD